MPQIILTTLGIAIIVILLTKKTRALLRVKLRRARRIGKLRKGVLLNKFLYYLVSDKKFRKVGAKFMTGSAG